MKTTYSILVIEDRYGLDTITNFCKQYGDDLSLKVAATFSEAVQTLKNASIDLAIIDISSGYGLQTEDLQRLTYKFPSVPCIALTRKEQRLEDPLLRLGIAACLTLPISSAGLEAAVRSLLDETTRAKIQGLPLYSLLQMLENDKITCSLRVTAPMGNGYIYVDQGRPIAAESGDLLHEEALSAMLVRDGTFMEIRHYNGQRRREIHKPLMPIIMEAFRLKDEKIGASTNEGPQALRTGFFFQHSYGGNRLALETGSPVTVEDEDGEAKMVCTVAGTVANHSLILLPPDLPQRAERRWGKGSSFTVKYMYMGELCTFKSELIQEIDDPCHLLFLGYPKTVQIDEMRRATRITTFVPAVLEYQNGYKLTGTINDISCLGCLFYSRITAATPLPTFDIGYHVRIRCELPGLQGSRLIPAVARNIRKSETDLHLGLLFTGLSPKLRQLIDTYAADIQEQRTPSSTQHS